MQLKIMHINTWSMISTFDGLLLTLKQDTFDERKKKPLSGRIIKVRKKLTLFGNHIIFQGTRFHGLRNCKMISLFKNNLRLGPILAVLIHSL